MGDWMVQLVASQGFLPHGYCFQWSPNLLALMVGSDAVVTASYYTLPLALLTFVRARKDVRFHWVFVLFAAFIFLCGTTHLVDMVTIWMPAYWLQAGTKALTALVSAATAIALWVLMPKLLKLPSNEQLTTLVARLEHEVAERRAAQGRLDELNAELERRVQQRTDELEESVRERERLKDADRARQVAEASNRAKSEFLSSMSHELRTPLNAILGFSQLLELDAQKRAAPEQERQWHGHVQAAGQHLLSLIDDVLEMARIEATGVAVTQEAVDLSRTAAECLAMMQASAQARNITLTIEAEPAGAVVATDPRRLRQVLVNLVGNAIKYNRPGGRVDARLGLAAGQLSIQVSDNGVGMTESQRAQLFSPFNRLGRETDARFPGTGLGLVITKQVIEALGGSISVRSSPRQGSEFLAVVPVG